MKFSLLNTNEPKKVAAAILFLLAFFAFFWEIISAGYPTNQIKMSSPTTRFVSQKNSIRSNSSLFTVPLFGDYVPDNLSTTNIKQSMLDLKVVGIMFADKEQESQVVIQTNNGEENAYGIGDTLPGGAIIKRISKQEVVVLHNGSYESLSFPKNELIFDVPAKPLIEE